jgi:N-acetylated-alpha-linked acidic dipeptidase
MLIHNSFHTAVSYLNLDVSVAGTNFHGSASPSLALLLKSAAEQIEHPSDKARSLWEMQDGGDWRQFNSALGLVGSFEDEDVEDMFTSDTGIKALGSGSDYTAFLQRYGVASTDMGYGGGPSDPPYHYHRYA